VANSVSLQLQNSGSETLIFPLRLGYCQYVVLTQIPNHIMHTKGRTARSSETYTPLNLQEEEISLV